MNKKSVTGGFTLVELTIVLLIIGLLGAAVLVGQELVHAAKIRNTVSDYNRYVTAAGAFQAKYGYIPGDIPAQKADAFGLTIGGPCPIGTYPAAGIYLPDGCNYTTSLTTGDGKMTRLSTENANFFQHLSRAGLIEGGYTASGFLITSLVEKTFAVSPLGSTFFPDNTQRGEDGFHYGGKSSFLMGVNLAPLLDPVYGFYASGGSVASALNKFTPYDAYGVDAKMDDGNPFLGKMFTVAGYDIVGYTSFPGTFNITHTPLPIALGLFSPQCCLPPSTNCQAQDAIYDIGVENPQCTVALQWGG